MLEIKGIYFLENKEHPKTDMMLINYQKENEFVQFGNVVLACFTTAHARLHLYENLQPLGERVLYFDTYSIIYQHDDSQFNPIVINSLGGWTDRRTEWRPHHQIHVRRSQELCLRNPGGKSVFKVKGLALNYGTSQIVSTATLEKC
jgi:hypothetical protein